MEKMITASGVSKAEAFEKTGTSAGKAYYNKLKQLIQ
jgi:hypothetical protein